MSVFQLSLIIYVIKIVVVILMIALPIVPLTVWIERRLIARMQQRPGPNRVGIGKFRLLGLGQAAIADPIKLLLKEDCKPASIYWFLHTISPALTVIPAFVVLCIVPVGGAIGLHFKGHDMAAVANFGVTDLPSVGILFYLAMTGLGLYGIVMAGWASNSKYSLLGGIRSSAQMLSYELAMGLSLVGLLLIANTLSLREIISQQEGGIWNWYVWRQPVACFLFLIAGFAETNRLPFDLAEGESELGGGFHTEYGSMKFATFFMAEYLNMFAFSAIFATLFCGGFHGPIGALDNFLAAHIVTPIVGGIGSFIGGLFPASMQVLSVDWASVGLVIVGHVWLMLKVISMLCFFVIVRGTLPRLRYDQLMNFGWKLMFPLALVNMVVTAAIMAFAPKMTAGTTASTGVVVSIILCIAGFVQLAGFDHLLNVRKRRLLAAGSRLRGFPGQGGQSHVS